MGEPWPAKYLPIVDEQGALLCLDLESGKVIDYDNQRMDHEGPGQWRKSFKAEAASLAALFEQWLGSSDTLSDMQREMRAVQERMAEETIAKFEGASEAYRASHGYDGPDWRNEVRRRCGVPPRP